MKAENKRNCVCGSCSVAGIVWSIIAGVAAGVLFYLGYITAVVTGVWIAFSIAAFSLVFISGSTLFSSCSEACARFAHCLRKNLKCLLAGTLGTIIMSIIALSITLDVGSIVPTIIIALLVLFFVLLISAFVNFLKCTTES